jgi:hypothetical protein
MVQETFTQTARSRFMRIFALVFGLPLGALIWGGAIVLLFWNEGKAIKTTRALQEGAAKVVSIVADDLNPANANRLVHVQGRVDTGETLHDPLFRVSWKALRLRRLVEAYQWKERQHRREQKTPSGRRKTVTSYSYEQTWSSIRIDSSTFQQPAGHENQVSFPYPCATWVATNFQLGAFSLQPALRDQLTRFTPLGVRVGEPPPDVRQAGFRPLLASFYRGDNPSFPQIGDVRVVYEAVGPDDYSIIAAQQGATLGAYQTESGETLAMVRSGKLAAAEMFSDAHLWNLILTWARRVGGFLLMIVGLRLALYPLNLAANLLPGFFGGLAFLTGFLGFIFATALTAVTISLAWVTYRPHIAVPVFSGGLLLAVIIGWFAHRRHRQYRSL